MITRAVANLWDGAGGLTYDSQYVLDLSDTSSSSSDIRSSVAQTSDSTDGDSGDFSGGFGAGWSDPGSTVPKLIAIPVNGAIEYGCNVPGVVEISLGCTTCSFDALISNNGLLSWDEADGTQYTLSGGADGPLFEVNMAHNNTNMAISEADASDDHLTLTAPDGTTYQFYGFDQGAEPGAFYQSTSPGGEMMTASYNKADGTLQKLDYFAAGSSDPYKELQYKYNNASGNVSAEILLGINPITGKLTPVREQQYVYYQAGQSTVCRAIWGKCITISNGTRRLTRATAAFVDANPDTYYFRYDTGSNQEHLLERVMLPNAYAAALALGQGDPATSSYWSGDSTTIRSPTTPASTTCTTATGR